jgi:hypothetical protein
VAAEWLPLSWLSSLPQTQKSEPHKIKGLKSLQILIYPELLAGTSVSALALEYCSPLDISADKTQQYNYQ